MALFPDNTVGPSIPRGLVPPPIPQARPGVTPVVTSTPQPTALSGSGETITLDALMARQKAAAARQSGVMQQGAENIPQGLSQMAWTLVNALQERSAEKGIETGHAAIADAFKHVDPNGQLTNDALATIMQYDPEMGAEMYKTAMGLKAAQGKTEQWTKIPTPQGESGEWYQNQNGDTKKVGGSTDTSAWKPSDIAARADDYSKAASTYNTASPSWQSMKEAAAISMAPEGTSEGKGAADYNMIVAFAKLLDPNSVVREGEVRSAAMTEGDLGALQGWLNTWKQEGSLTNDIRKGIMVQANSRMKAYYDQAKGQHDWISGVATRHNVDPNDVVPPLGDFSPYEEAKPADPNKPDPNATPAPPPPADAIDLSTLTDPATGGPDPNKLQVGKAYTFKDGSWRIYQGGDPNSRLAWKNPAGGG